MKTKMRSEDFTSVKIKSSQIKKLAEISWDKLHILQLLLTNQRSNPSKMNSWKFLICPAVLNMASQSPNLYKHCAKTARPIKLDRLGREVSKELTSVSVTLKFSRVPKKNSFQDYEKMPNYNTQWQLCDLGILRNLVTLASCHYGQHSIAEHSNWRSSAIF